MLQAVIAPAAGLAPSFFSPCLGVPAVAQLQVSALGGFVSAFASASVSLSVSVCVYLWFCQVRTSGGGLVATILLLTLLGGANVGGLGTILLVTTLSRGVCACHERS